MNTKNKFTVTKPSVVFWLCLCIFIFFVIVLVLNTIFSPPPHAAMYIIITIVALIPCALGMLWSRVSNVSVDGTTITVRKLTGLKYSFDVSEITQVDWKVVTNQMGQNDRILIKTSGRKKVSIETLMIGFEKMSAYIEKNVDSEKIKRTERTINFGK